MNSAEMRLASIQPENSSSSTASAQRRGPRSHILRLLRGALDARPGETVVSIPRDAMASIAGEFDRLGTVLREDRLWDPLDVARYLGISRNSVYAQVDAGALPCVRIGGLLKFDPAKIRAIGKGEMKPQGTGRVAALPVNLQRKK